MQVLVMQAWLALMGAGRTAMTTSVARYFGEQTLEFIYWRSDLVLQ